MTMHGEKDRTLWRGSLIFSHYHHLLQSPLESNFAKIARQFSQHIFLSLNLVLNIEMGSCKDFSINLAKFRHQCHKPLRTLWT